jgi:hypothetical protein
MPWSPLRSNAIFSPSFTARTSVTLAYDDTYLYDLPDDPSEE